MGDLQRTPLYAAHLKLGARMVAFGGWEMPVQYTGIIDEHRAVRTAVGLFDVSHMGEFEFRGPAAGALIQMLITNDVSQLEVGQARYSPLCRADGTCVDDVLVYRLAPERWLMVVNAANIDKDWAHIEAVRAAGFPGVEARNVSDEVALIAVQGPRSQALLAPLTGGDLAGLRPFRALLGAPVAGVRTLVVSRTGYTGEDGFELYVRAGDALELWESLLEAEAAGGGGTGAAGGAGDEDDTAPVPCGLGARDTLRFEACLPLYGHELDDTVTPLEAGLAKFVRFATGDFVGRDALLKQKESGLTRRLVGFEMLDRGIPRQGYELADAATGAVVGRVTSGTQCPTVGKAMGMGYVRTGPAAEGTELDVVIRGRAARARVVPRPFYRRAT